MTGSASKSAIFKWVSRGLLALTSAIFLSVISEWFVHVVEDKGWYNHAGRIWDRGVSIVMSVPTFRLALCFAGMVFGAAVAITAHRSFGWRIRVQARKRSAKDAPRKTLEAKEIWIPLHQALRYLVYESVWAEKREKPASKREFNATISREFLERLARGELRARGSKGSNWEDSRPTEIIPPSYWTHGFIMPFGSIVLSDQRQDAAGNPVDKITYRNVLIHREDLYSVWPESGKKNLSQLASFCEPQRKAIQAELSAQMAL